MKKIFVISYFIIIFFGITVLFRTGNEVSVLENRSLSNFSKLTVKNVINQEYQNNFEDSFKDQFWGRDLLKNIDISLKNINKKTKLYRNICESNYVKLDSGLYTFDCGDYIVDYNYSFDRYDTVIKDKIKNYDDIDNYADLYYYFIDRSKYFDFINNNLTFNIEKYMDKNYREFSFKDYSEYVDLFYKTDHHWNYKGSYLGYKDIISMLFEGKEEILIPNDKVEFNTLFYGSSARSLGINLFKENFVAYKFDIPRNVQYINGEVKSYGDKESYYEGNYSHNPWTNHYAAFYGSDYAEVVFDFNNINKENLLILSNSFSNPINELIASHFNKTYVIDLRFYESTYNKKFNYVEYIDQNKIDKVLVISDLNYFISEEFDLEVGE